ncbi:MAG TPA: hypothetical protein VFF70_08220, partial [Anaerolineae bacterium]|nr:hypothetical protein [Anaerolineae bacterium]
MTRTEWRWVLIWISIALIITSLPYAIGLARSTPDKVFGGFVIAIEDGNSYLAKMNEGAHGAWLFHLPYTSEPHTGTFFYLFHLLLGKVSAVTSLAPIIVYHLARLIFGALLLLTIYRFIAMFIASRAARRIAFLLIIFSGGLGWLLILLGQTGEPIDLISPEAFTFLVVYAFPHIALARTFLLLGFILVWDADPHNSARDRRAVWAGVCWLLMGIIVPFYVAVVYAILVAAWLASSIGQRRIDWSEAGRSIVAGVIATPILIYTFIVVSTDPIWSNWAAQLVILSPSPLQYVAAYLVVGALAVMGILHVRRSNLQPQASNFHRLIGWVIIIPFIIYLPFNSQRRLIESWQIPLCIFASIGLVYRVLPTWRRSRVVQRLSQHRRYSARGLRVWAWSALLFLSAATYILLLSEQSTRMLAQLPPSFRDGTEIAALDWLNQQATYDDVVLSSYN